MPPSCFLPPHWLQHPQARGLCTGLGLWIEPAPEDGWERSNIIFPPGPTSVPQHPSVPAGGSRSPAPTGLLAMEAGSFSTDTRGPVPLAERSGTPLRPFPRGLRTLGSCPCAPYPGHRPGSAGPEEENASQIQDLLAREVFLSDHQALPLWEMFTNP